uniref:Uncharacterized protein n=1 Tax=Romanomermis culicivorax TaxID=13658 RepID=A0A915KZD3_ROMCU
MKEPFRSVFPGGGGNRPTYERKPRTIEYTQDLETSKRRIDLSLVGQIVVVVIIVFIGLWNYYQCGSRDTFAGITPVLAGLDFW